MADGDVKEKTVEDLKEKTVEDLKEKTIEDEKTEDLKEKTVEDSGDSEQKPVENSEISDLEKKIIKQIEYYYGDMNLPRDHFLQEKIKEDDGWVALDTMLLFKRLATLSEDKEVIANALKKSTADLVEVNEDNTKIRRNPSKPLPDNTKERKESIDSRSVYAKGFPENVELDSLMEFCEKFGKVETLFMRRDKKRFKGSIFATYANLEDAKSFVEAENLKFEDIEIEKKSKKDYFEGKLKAKKENSTKKTENADAEKAAKEQKLKDEDKKAEDQMTKGAVLFLKGLTKETTREDIKNYLNDYGNVAWVEHAEGDDTALIRFDKGCAQESLDKCKAECDGKVTINGADLESRVLEGEEEKEYWKKMFRDLANKYRRNNYSNNKNTNRKRGHGNHNQRGGHGKKPRR